MFGSTLRSPAQSSRSSSRPCPKTPKATPPSASRSPTWKGRAKRSARPSERWSCCPLQGCALRPLRPAPARARLHSHRRKREGARQAGAAAEHPVSPHARLARDRPQLRPTEAEFTIRDVATVGGERDKNRDTRRYIPRQREGGRELDPCVAVSACREERGQAARRPTSRRAPSETRCASTGVRTLDSSCRPPIAVPLRSARPYSPSA